MLSRADRAALVRFRLLYRSASSVYWLQAVDDDWDGDVYEARVKEAEVSLV